MQRRILYLLRANLGKRVPLVLFPCARSSVSHHVTYIRREMSKLGFRIVSQHGVGYKLIKEG